MSIEQRKEEIFYWRERLEHWVDGILVQVDSEKKGL
jgi:hypothetical protein